ncbi:MAG: hypothetical protein TREMPRED_002567 [Tremellales sp. Tagirdzhanova-0007]|nr:MAG: hypothetical protein TREMPRED_002567 [Tremellales sp. Tagirdzhanova-0007]
MPLRVLALCGFTQNAHIYSKQLGAIRKTCKDVDFGTGFHTLTRLFIVDLRHHPVFLEPPHVVEKADMPWTRNMNEFDSDATTDKEEQTAETTPRAWTFASEDRSVYRKFDETIQYWHEFLVKEPPFDGIMGFSQGACMAAILAALVNKHLPSKKRNFAEKMVVQLETPRLHPLFPPDPPLPKFKFLISVGGFLPAPKNLEDWFPLPSSLPTLHIIGRNDTIVTAERSQTLIDQCKSARVEFHEGGGP